MLVRVGTLMSSTAVSGDGIGGGGFLLAAPVLTLLSGPEDSTPDANVDLPEDIEGGMFLRSQIATDSIFTSPTETDVEIDATAVSNGELDLGLSSLAGGTYYWRVRVLSDALSPISPWSNTETVTIAAGDDDDYAAWMSAA
jgi:hypothetical protein